MQRITKRVRPTGGGLFHDSRGDVQQLATMVNILVDKVNELVDAENARQRKEKEGSK